MTAVDWGRETLTRMREQPARSALAESVAELRRGIERRALYYRARTRGTAPMQIGGYESKFVVRNPTDIERARTANRETAVMEFVLDGLDETSVFWDVGAYHGHYTVHASQTGADVIAYEPVFENRRQISKHVQRNDPPGEIEIRPVALSDAEDVVTIGGPAPSEAQLGQPGIEVHTMRGEWLEPKPDVIKIDVEGHEAAVLAGLRRELPHVERVAVEVHGDNERAVRDQLRLAGFDVREIDTPRSETYLGGVRG